MSDPVFAALGMSGQGHLLDPAAMYLPEAYARPFDCPYPIAAPTAQDAAFAAHYQQAFFAHVVAAATAAAAAAASSFCQDNLLLPEVLPSISTPQHYQVPAMPFSWPAAAAAWPQETAGAADPQVVELSPAPPGLMAPGSPGTPRRRTSAGNGDMTPPKAVKTLLPPPPPPMVLKLSDIVCKSDFSEEGAKESPGAILLQMLKQGEGTAEGKFSPTGRRRRRGGRGRGRTAKGQGNSGATEEAHDDESSETEAAELRNPKGEDTPSTVASDQDAEAARLASIKGNAAPLQLQHGEAARRGKNGAPRVSSSSGSVWI